MASTSLPVLLPSRAIPSPESSIGWRPKRNLDTPNPPPPEDPRAVEMDMARQVQDGKPPKKVRPRRTVDYGGAMGRWTLVRNARVLVFACGLTNLLCSTGKCAQAGRLCLT